MRFVNLDNCKTGMVIGKSLYGNNGALLLKSGAILKQNHIDALHELGYAGVYVDDKFSTGINIREVVDHSVRNNAIVAIQGLFSNTKFTEILKNEQTISEIDDIIACMVDQIASSQDAVVNVSSLKTYDSYTFQHCVDVGILSIVLGKDLKIRKSKLIQLGKAAFFHDLGKMFISKSIINKPSHLTPVEFEEIKKHPQYGYDCLKSNLKQPKMVCNGVLYHHEKYGGGGYPKNISGSEIPFFSRIIAVTDVYDAISSKRTYKKAMLASEAYEYVMGNVGNHFDPEVVKAFVRKVAPFPVGICILLSDGRKALVVENKPDFMMRPLIKILHEYENEPDIYIDLARDAGARSITIVGTV